MEVNIIPNHKYAVVVTFSYDPQVSVMLFDSEEAAWEFIKEDILREYTIDTVENGFDSEQIIFEDENRATLITHGTDIDYTTGWCVGTVFELG